MRNMLRLLQDIGALVVAVLVVLALFVWIASLSSAYQSCENQEAQQQAAEQIKEHQGAIHVVGAIYRCTGQFVDANHGPITGVATILIAAFTATIWLINRTQLRHTQRIERAYISCGGFGEFLPEIITDANGQPVIGPNGQPAHRLRFTGAFHVAVNNHGKTPGETFRFAIEFRDAGAVLPEEPEYRNFIHHHNWIGPGTQSRGLFPVTPPPNLRNPMIVYGRVFFRDVFSRTEHWSGFYQDFDRNTGMSQSIPPPSRAYTDWDHDD